MLNRFPYTGWSTLETGKEREKVDVEIRFDGCYDSKSTDVIVTVHRLASDYSTEVLCGGRLLHCGILI